MTALFRRPATVQDWFAVGIAIGHDRTVRLTLELGSRIDSARLEESLRRLASVHPILRCRFAPGLFRAWWQERDDIGSRPWSTVVEGGLEELHRFMARPVDPVVDPLVQVLVLRSTADTLCIKLSHAAMDGGAFKHLVYDLTAIYRSLGGEPAAVPEEDTEWNRGQGQVLRRFRARELVDAFLTQPFHKKTWGFPYQGGDLSRVSFSERTAAGSVSALRAASKARGASINDSLMTCFARAVFDLGAVPPHQPMPMVQPVDLRRYLPEKKADSFINLSSLSWITLRHAPGAAFEQDLAQIHDALEQTGKANPGVGLAMVMQVLAPLGYGAFTLMAGARARMARRQGREFPSLSNIGPLDPAALRLGTAEVTRARFYAPVAYPPTFVMVAGSYADRIYFTFAYPPAVVPGGLIERILDRVRFEVDALCATVEAGVPAGQPVR